MLGLALLAMFVAAGEGEGAAINRSGAVDSARAFLIQRHIPVERLSAAVVLDIDRALLAYLSEPPTAQAADAPLPSPPNAVGWRVKFFGPGTSEQIDVKLGLNGQIVSFSRFLPSHQPGAMLGEHAARILAEAFLTGRMGFNLADWRFQGATESSQPARRDYQLVWLEERDASRPLRRAEVYVQGAEVSGFNAEWDLPRPWVDGYAVRVKKGDQGHLAAQAAVFVLALLVIWLFIRHVRNGEFFPQLNYRLPLTFAALAALSPINLIPAHIYLSAVPVGKGIVVLKAVLTAVLNGITLGAAGWLALGAAAPLFSSQFPDQLNPRWWLQRKSLRHPQTLNGLLAGIAFGVVATAALWFLLSSRVIASGGALWAVDLASLSSSALPAVMLLTDAIVSAGIEELFFRLFLIALLTRLLKVRWAAALIQAGLWAFVKTDFSGASPLSEFVIVGLTGIGLGGLFLRFGIHASFAAHLSLVVVTSLISASEYGLLTAVQGGVAAGAAAVAVTAAALMRMKTNLAPAAGLLNREQPPVVRSVARERSEPIPQTLEWSAMSRRARRWGIVLGGIGVASVALIPRSGHLDDGYPVTIGRSQAVSIAKEALRARYDVQPDDFHVAVTDIGRLAAHSPETAAAVSGAVSYAVKEGGREAAQRTLLHPSGALMRAWRIRFYTPREQLHYAVAVHQVSGEAFVSRHAPDDHGGAFLDPDSAKALATRAMEEAGGAADRWKFVDGRTRPLPNRTDYTFTYKANFFQLRDAVLQRVALVQGDDVQVSGNSLELPNDWRVQIRELAAVSRNILLTAAALIVLVVGWVMAVRKRTQSALFKARLGFTVAVSLVLLDGAVLLLERSAVLWQAAPNMAAVGDYLPLIFRSLARAVGIGLLTSLAAAAVVKSDNSNTKGSDGFAAAFGAAGVGFLLWTAIAQTAGGSWQSVRFYSLPMPAHLPSHLPWFGDLVDGLAAALLTASLLCLFWEFWQLNRALRLIKASVLIVISAGAGAAWALSATPDIWPAALAGGAAAAAAGGGLLAVHFWGRRHFVTFVFGIWTVILSLKAAVYLRWEETPLAVNGWILLAAAFTIQLVVFSRSLLRGRMENTLSG